MSMRNGAAKVGSVLMALLIGAGVIALAGSLMLPSTKRARVDWDEVERRRAQYGEAAAPATEPTTVPTTAPSASASPTTP